MKIGILTFQHSINFGAQLQCYALQEILKRMGNEVEIIQYYPAKKIPFYRNLKVSKNGIRKSILFLILRFLYQEKARRTFSRFKELNYIMTEALYDNEDLGKIATKLDAIIVGSDQVWTPAYQNQLTYFLNLPETYQGLKISYAACSPLNIIDEKADKLEIAQLLTEFNAISVRDEETYNFVENLISTKPTVVLDPTFLYKFDSVSSSISKPYSQYILTYILGNEIPGGGHKEMINEIKKVYGDVPVVSIVLIENSPQFFSWADKSYRAISPFDWLFLIRNALFFYTDSFHGLVFSLKYQVPCVAYYTEKLRATRFLDMANRFGLDYWIVNSIGDFKKKESLYRKIDYTELNQRIDLEVQRSLAFLNDALTTNSYN